MAHQFKNVAEANAVMGAFYAAGKFDCWNSSNVFGKVYARYCRGGVWFKVLGSDLVRFGA